MILRKIPFVNKKHYSPGGLPVVAAEGDQRICSKVQNGGAEEPSDNPCQRNFMYLISILAKFVLFGYNHVVIVIQSQYRESDLYDLG